MSKSNQPSAKYTHPFHQSRKNKLHGAGTPYPDNEAHDTNVEGGKATYSEGWGRDSTPRDMGSSWREGNLHIDVRIWQDEDAPNKGKYQPDGSQVTTQCGVDSSRRRDSVQGEVGPRPAKSGGDTIDRNTQTQWRRTSVQSLQVNSNQKVPAGKHPASMSEISIDAKQTRLTKQNLTPGQFVIAVHNCALTTHSDGALTEFTQTSVGWVQSKKRPFIIVACFDTYAFALPVRTSDGRSLLRTGARAYRDHIAVKQQGTSDPEFLGRYGFALEATDEVKSGATVCTSDAVQLSYREELRRDSRRLTTESTKKLLEEWIGNMIKAVDPEIAVLESRIEHEANARGIKANRKSDVSVSEENNLYCHLADGDEGSE